LPFIHLFGIFTLVPALVSFIGSYVFLIDFLRKKQWRSLALGVFILFCFSISLTLLLIIGFVSKDLILGKGLQPIIEMVVILLILSAIHGTIGLLLRGFIQWYDDLKWKEALMQKNFETELALIKSQIDPHLLFNTLNNIDALMEKDIQKASLYLNKLSEIMRFTLYETKTDKIPLQKELAYIEKYIELQKIRTSNPDFVHLNIVGETGNCTIAPMVFIPFIENAFKHAAPLKTGNVIDIKIRTEANTIFFMCKNIARSPFLDKNKEGGIGNELIKKRLALLYPNNHILNIDKNENMYEVNLKIERHEN
jgi:two-component system, LytTR family, sensor kinase